MIFLKNELFTSFFSNTKTKILKPHKPIDFSLALLLRFLYRLLPSSNNCTHLSPIYPHEIWSLFQKSPFCLPFLPPSKLYTLLLFFLNPWETFRKKSKVWRYPKIIPIAYVTEPSGFRGKKVEIWCVYVEDYKKEKGGVKRKRLMNYELWGTLGENEKEGRVGFIVLSTVFKCHTQLTTSFESFMKQQTIRWQYNAFPNLLTFGSEAKQVVPVPLI